MGSIVRMDESAGAGARAHRVGRSRVIAIGEKNLRAPHPRDIGKAFVARRDRIDAKVSFSVTNQVAVEVVSVRLGKPGPGKDIDGDFMHGSSPLNVVRFEAGANKPLRQHLVSAGGSGSERRMRRKGNRVARGLEPGKHDGEAVHIYPVQA